MPLSAANEIRQIESEQAAIRQQISRLVSRLQELDARKRTLRRRLDRVIGRVQRLAGMSVPQDVARDVEEQINREGYMERIIEKRFKSQSVYGPGSPKWKRLTPLYLRQKVAAGFPPNILVRTGDLFSSAVAYASGTFRLDGKIEFPLDSLPEEYAEYHQYGTGKMPARPFYNEPTQRELEPSMRRAKVLVRQKLRELQRMA